MITGLKFFRILKKKKKDKREQQKTRAVLDEVISEKPIRLTQLLMASKEARWCCQIPPELRKAMHKHGRN